MTQGAGERRGGAAASLQQLQVVAAAMASSVVACGLVAWAVTSGVLGEPVAAALEPPWPGVLVTLAALPLVAAPLLERRLAAPAGAGGAGEDAPAALARYRIAKVVGFALRESAAVIGLVVAVTTGQGRWAYALCAGALLLMAMAWPRAGDLPALTGPAAPGSVEPR
jgi:hypothetical protein